MAHVLLLVQVDGIERKGIGPALVVPVSDMLAEHDDVDTCSCLMCIKLFQYSISWRTVRAPL